MQVDKTGEGIKKAKLLMANNDLVGAKEEIERILEVNPKDQVALNMLATVYFKLKEYDRALKFWETLLNENRDVPSLYTNVGLCYFKLGNYEKALQHFDRALELNPTPSLLNYRGLTLSKMGNFREAMEAFLKAGSKKMAEEMRKKIEEQGVPVFEEERVEEALEMKDVPKKMKYPDTEGFYCEEGVFVMNLKEKPIYSRLQNLICILGDISLKPIKKKFKGSETKALFKSRDFLLFEISGKGTVFMGIKEENFYPCKIENDACYINEDFIIGFTSGLQWENGRIMAPSGEAINMASFTGNGYVFIEVTPGVKTVEIREDSVVGVAFSKLVGWHGKVVPEEIKELSTPEESGILLIMLKGKGEVFVRSEET